MLLEKITPAEVLLLTASDNFTVKEALKVTFLDLVLKQVLETTEITFQSHERDPIRKQVYVKLGGNLRHYHPSAHERLLTTPFWPDSERQLLLRNLIKIAYEKIQRPDSFKLTVMKALHGRGYIKQSLFGRIMGSYSQTEAGKNAQQTLERELGDLSVTAGKILASGDRESLVLLKKLKGNIFLIKTVQFTFVERLDKEIHIVEKKAFESAFNSTGTGCIGCGIDFDLGDGGGCLGCLGD